MGELPSASVVGRVIGEARDYAEFQALLRLRAAELQQRRADTDAVMKTLPDAYTSKLLAPNPRKKGRNGKRSALRGIGQVSMGPLLAALGLRLVVMTDDVRISSAFASETMLPGKNIDRRGKKRGGRQEWSRQMNARRTLLLSHKKRKRIARLAARVRWGKRKARTRNS